MNFSFRRFVSFSEHFALKRAFRVFAWLILCRLLGVVAGQAKKSLYSFLHEFLLCFQMDTMVHMMRKNVYTLLRMNVKEAKVNYSVVFPGRVSPQLNYKNIPGRESNY